MVPNMVLRPRLSSIKKNSVDQKGLAGKRAITSVNAMNARPVPSIPCAHTKGKRQGKKSEQELYLVALCAFSQEHSTAPHLKQHCRSLCSRG